MNKIHDFKPKKHSIDYSENYNKNQKYSDRILDYHKFIDKLKFLIKNKTFLKIINDQESSK